MREARRTGRDPEVEEWEPERFVEVEEEEQPEAPSDREPPRERRRRPLPDDVAKELAENAPAGRVDRLRDRLEEASRAYERDRYRDAVKLLKPLAEQAPGAASVRELYGLTLYRLGRWRDAIRELEAFQEITQSYDQHPTLADCYRALKRWPDVDRIWDDLKQASPEPALMTEGRIVVAGSLADRGKLQDAIDLLEQSSKNVKRPKPYHLRVWYTLADMYERAGEVPRARELFRRVAEHDPELYDVRARLRSL